MTVKAKRRVHKFMFDKETMKSGDPVHIALVTSGANMTEVMTLKAYDSVTTTTQRESHSDDQVWESDTERTSVYTFDGEIYHITDESHAIKEYSVRIV